MKKSFFFTFFTLLSTHWTGGIYGELHSRAAEDAALLIEHLTNGEGKGLAFSRLADFVDEVGPRLCGSEEYNTAAETMLTLMKSLGLENVHGEQVTTPHWVRGEESLELVSPRTQKLAMLSFGTSVGTSSEGITAPVIVLKSLDELETEGDKGNVVGKIVVFDYFCDWEAFPVDCYSKSVKYRSTASAVSEQGGVAVLVRSVAANSIYSPHTGKQSYTGKSPRIPAAAITIEDASMFSRMQARGDNITVRVVMGAQTLPDTQAVNVVGEIIGSEFPDEVVLVSGHLDSWDVGQGAMDDGGGLFISLQALAVLKDLGLRPRRTLRVVGWACEEFGGIGAHQYYEAHKAEIDQFSMVMESDLGVFNPLGLQFTGNTAANEVISEIALLLTGLNASRVDFDSAEGVDIDDWMSNGVPGASILTENEKYFWYHHSDGDTMQVLDRGEMDRCTAVWAVYAYSVANLDNVLPRNTIQ